MIDACERNLSSAISRPNVRDPINVKLALSTEYGGVAFDNLEGNNSLYAHYLAKLIGSSNSSIHDLLWNVWNKVYLFSGNQQSPAQYFGQTLDQELFPK